jgi:hypothetical protein
VNCTVGGAMVVCVFAVLGALPGCYVWLVELQTADMLL